MGRSTGWAQTSSRSPSTRRANYAAGIRCARSPSCPLVRSQWCAVARSRPSLGVDIGMLGDELLRLVVHPGDVALQLVALHPPLAASADLYRLEFAASHEGVGL